MFVNTLFGMYNKTGEMNKKGVYKMSYIDLIKETRRKHKISQKQMAELLKTTQQQYSKYENMQQEMPIRHLITICEYFNISADWLLGLNNKLQNKDKPLNVYDLLGTADNILSDLGAMEEKKKA